VFSDAIDWTATAYGNGSIYIQYDDSLLNTTDTQFYLYESFNGTDTLTDTETQTGEQNIAYWVTGLNLSRMHYINLYFNHSNTFLDEQPLRRYILPINTTITTRTQATFDSLMNAIFGRPIINGVDVGWGNLLSCAIALILLVSFSPFNAGLGIIASGVGLASVKVAFIMSNAASLAIIPIVIIIGILYILTTKQPEAHL